MAVVLNPYLHFDGNAEEALHFYEGVFGGEGTISRYGENPMPELKEEHKDLVMHGDLQVNGMRLMLSDSGPMGVPVAGSNFAIALSGSAEDEATMTGYFEKLSEGGAVTVPLAKAGWGDTFGMLTDKFGIEWFVNIAGNQG